MELNTWCYSGSSPLSAFYCLPLGAGRQNRGQHHYKVINIFRWLNLPHCTVDQLIFLRQTYILTLSNDHFEPLLFSSNIQPCFISPPSLTNHSLQNDLTSQLAKTRERKAEMGIPSLTSKPKFQAQCAVIFYLLASAGAALPPVMDQSSFLGLEAPLPVSGVPAISHPFFCSTRFSAGT